jgi:hypothetical protein
VKRYLLAAIFIAAGALAACGGGGSHSATVPPASLATSGPGLFGSRNRAPAPGSVTASLSITIPRPPQSASAKRRAKYVSPSTAGIAIEVKQNSYLYSFVFYPLSNTANCVLNQSQTAYVCTNLSVQAPPGPEQLIVATYDSTATDQQGFPTGNLLSAAEPNVTIQPGRTNNLAVTLLPIATNIVTAASPPRCPLAGTPVSLNTTYTAYDAAGDDLTGLTLFNALSIVNVTSDNSYQFSPSTLTSGSGSLSFSYNGAGTEIGVFEVLTSIGADGFSNEILSTSASIPVGTAGPHMVYVSDAGNNQILGYDVCANNPTPSAYSLPPNTNPDDVKFDRSSSPGAPRVFAISHTNNTLVWLDVTSSPGTVLQTLSFGGTPHHANDSSTSPYLFVSIGSSTFKKFQITEGPTPALTAVATASPSSTLNGPRGFGLGGPGNDILLANTGAGTVQAVNPTTMTLDGAVSVPGSPTEVSGPNANQSCAIAAGPNGTMSGVSLVGPGGTPTLLGSPVGTNGNSVAVAFFPPQIANSGTIGYGGTVGLSATYGTAVLVTCDADGFAFSEYWGLFMSEPVALAPSEYASLAVPGIIYAVGYDNGVPSLQAYMWDVDHDLGSITLPSNANPTGVTAGP